MVVGIIKTIVLIDIKVIDAAHLISSYNCDFSARIESNVATAHPAAELPGHVRAVA